MDIAILQALSKEQIKALLRGIQNAFDEHVRWACRCQASLLNHGNADEELLEEDAHRKCNFGRWYYGKLPENLRASADFNTLGEMHRRFHEAARVAASTKRRGEELSIETCENFITAQSDLLIALNQYLKEVSEGDQLFDPLTGLLSRHKMHSIINHERARAERSGQALTLAMADLDNFKGVNDRYGHEAGDMVLREIAARFSAGLRVYDLLFRVGGEEFLFLFPDTDEKGAAKICERIRNSIEKAAVVLGGGRSVVVTVSFGVASLEVGMQLPEALRMADMALYKAKSLGRNLVCSANDGATD